MSFRDDLITLVSRTSLFPAGTVLPYTPPHWLQLLGDVEFVGSIGINRLISNPQEPGGDYDPRGEITWILTVFSRTRQGLEDITDKLPFILIRRGDFVGASGLVVYSTFLENLLVEPSDESQSSWVAILRFRSQVGFPY